MRLKKRKNNQLTSNAQEIKLKDYIINELKNLLEEEKSNNQIFSGGRLLNAAQQITLNEFYGVPNQKWKLLYRASRDGFSPSTFHKLCDDKGATMTVIKSSENNGGWIFGGFTTQSWKDAVIRTGSWFRSDDQAFMFTLTNPHLIPPTKYSIIEDKQKHAMYANDKYGPSFGYFDLSISQQSNVIDYSYSDFPKTYNDTTGKGDLTFTGSHYFRTSNMEVYAIIM